MKSNSTQEDPGEIKKLPSHLVPLFSTSELRLYAQKSSGDTSIS